jgi:hypothetical protein
MDTGPLVAFLREAEADHEWAVAKFRELPVIISRRRLLAFQ